MAHRVTQKERTQRAFRAYLDLIDTADWLKREMRVPLESFDMTMQDFRLLEMLYREGALTMPDVGRRLGRVRQDVRVIVARLQERGWVGRMMVALPAVELERAHVAKSEAEQREGPRVGVVALTRSGKKMIANVFPRHTKMVKALMRVLDAREQESISKICRKLRSREAVFKFLREIRMVDEDEQAAEVREEAEAELERLTARMKARGRPRHGGRKHRALRIRR
jgi:MarR family transcriptional regulator, 2-MHQ and catechol-resistance regulon repressor